MKPLIPILVVATTSLAVASVQFAQQASAQRKRADAELVLRQKQDARVAQLERSQARLERELMMAREAAAPPGAVGAPPPGPRTGAGAGRIVGPFAALEQGQHEGPPPQLLRNGPRIMESPAARNFFRSRIKNSIRRMYEEAGPALGLSDEKSNQLLDLLADQQTRNMGRPNITDGQTFQQFAQDQQKKNNDEIKALIGQDKLDEWASYQKSLPDRAQLGQVRDQLEQAGVPMTDGQRTEMLAAITEETQRNPRPAYSPGVPQEETIAQMNQWQSDYDKALLDRAKQVLNTEQYNTYKEYQDWQSEMRNSLPRGPGGQNAIVRMGVSGGPVGPVTADAAMFIAAPLPAPAQPQPERK